MIEEITFSDHFLNDISDPDEQIDKRPVLLRAIGRVIEETETHIYVSFVDFIRDEKLIPSTVLGIVKGGIIERRVVIADK